MAPWIRAGVRCQGYEIDHDLSSEAAKLGAGVNVGPFENATAIYPTPDLVMCNPPWSGHWQNANYTEIFVRKLVTLFGSKIPLALLCPMGFRLNQRKGSKRATWLAETLEITSVISCPVTMYPSVEFHNEILFFNVKRVKPHYWIEKEIDVPLTKKRVRRSLRLPLRTQVPASLSQEPGGGLPVDADGINSTDRGHA